MKKQLMTLTVLLSLSCTGWAEESAKDKEKAKPNLVKIDGKERDVKFVEHAGKTYAIISCETGATCRNPTIIDAKFTEDLSKLNQALLEKIATEEKKETPEVKPQAMPARPTVKPQESLEKSIHQELADAVEHCGIRPRESGRSSSRSPFDLESVALGLNQQGELQNAMNSEASQRARCAAQAVAEYMDDKAMDLEEIEEEHDLSERITAERDYAKLIAAESNSKKKENMQAQLEKFREETKRLREENREIRNRKTKTVEATRKFIRNNVLSTAISDLGKTPFSGPTYLQSLAAHTPDVFSDVRKDIGTSMLQIYKLQTQSFLQYQTQALQTKDPREKARLEGRRDAFYDNAVKYGLYMNGAQSRFDLGQMSSAAKQEMDATITPNQVIGDVVSQYMSPAQQIGNYLTGGPNGSRSQMTTTQSSFLGSCGESWLPCLPDSQNSNAGQGQNPSYSGLRGQRVNGSGTGVGTPVMNQGPIRSNTITNGGNGRISTGLPQQVPR